MKKMAAGTRPAATRHQSINWIGLEERTNQKLAPGAAGVGARAAGFFARRGGRCFSAEATGFGATGAAGAGVATGVGAGAGDTLPEFNSEFMRCGDD